MENLIIKNVMRLVVVSSMLAISVNLYKMFGSGITMV